MSGRDGVDRVGWLVAAAILMRRLVVPEGAKVGITAEPYQWRLAGMPEVVAVLKIVYREEWKSWREK